MKSTWMKANTHICRLTGWQSGRMAELHTHLLCLLTMFCLISFSFAVVLSFSHSQYRFDECVNVYLFIVVIVISFIYFFFFLLSSFVFVIVIAIFKHNYPFILTFISCPYMRVPPMTIAFQTHFQLF